MRQEKEMELKEIRLKQLLAEKAEQEKEKEKAGEEKASGSSKISEETEKVTSSGRMRLENMIKPEYMRFFKTDKKIGSKPSGERTTGRGDSGGN